MSKTARQQRLIARTHEVLRAFFRDTNALEVFPPTLVPNPGMENEIRPFRLARPVVRELRGYFLHTSPEFAIKSTLHEVESDVFTIVRAYRDEVSSSRHHAEFQILEWYRRDASYERLMDDVETLFSRLIDALKLDSQQPMWSPPFARLTYRDAFRRFAGIDCDTRDPSAWCAALARARVSVVDSADVPFLESVAYSEIVEPALGAIGPCFIVDYPVRHAALAKRKEASSDTAERVEFYLPYPDPDRSGDMRGLELANGFSELLDPIEQRSRFEEASARIEQSGMSIRPMPDHVLRGIERLPATAGMALGVDRLVIWLAHQLYGETWTVPELYFGHQVPMEPNV